MKKIIIAIDGYSSTGKSSFAQRIAAELGYVYIDTGALYRAVTLHAARLGILTPETAALLSKKLRLKLAAARVGLPVYYLLMWVNGLTKKH